MDRESALSSPGATSQKNAHPARAEPGPAGCVLRVACCVCERADATRTWRGRAEPGTTSCASPAGMAPAEVNFPPPSLLHTLVSSRRPSGCGGPRRRHAPSILCSSRGCVCAELQRLQHASATVRSTPAPAGRKGPAQTAEVRFAKRRRGAYPRTAQHGPPTRHVRFVARDRRAGMGRGNMGRSSACGVQQSERSYSATRSAPPWLRLLSGAERCAATAHAPVIRADARSSDCVPIR